MNLADFLEHMNSGKIVEAGLKIHKYVIYVSRVAMQITCYLNNSFHEMEKIQRILFQLIGKPFKPT